MAVETHYRPGLIFKSRTSAHQEVCRTYSATRAVDGSITSEFRELLAEFAFIGGEYKYVNPETGADQTAPDIRGHFFDLDQQAEEKGWDKQEREIVARHMLRMAERRPGGDFSLWSKPAIAAPWRTYDETAADQIATVAQATGYIAEALSYEQENANRKPVVTALEALLEAGKVEEGFAAA